MFVDPIAAVVNVVNFNQATSQIGQTTLRQRPGPNQNWMNCWQSATRSNRDLQAIIDEHTERWGVKVTRSRSRMWSYHNDASAPWPNRRKLSGEKRAKVIHAQGELQA